MTHAFYIKREFCFITLINTSNLETKSNRTLSVTPLSKHKKAVRVVSNKAFKNKPHSELKRPP